MPDLPLADDDARYRAASGRDARWDGLLYLGVTTTGIYCRPSCPARKPLPQNCTYFSSAAACVAAGFRACKRCRPDSLPGSRHWDSRSDLCARAVTLIRDGVVDEVGVAGLAVRLSVSERQLTRVLTAELGAGAQQLNRTRRAHAARSLIEQTTMPLSDVAFAAGFGSVRQFNDVMLTEFGVAPSSYRRAQDGRGAEGADDQPVSDEPSEVVLRLRFRPPFTGQPLRRFLAAHAVVGLDQISETADTHTRLVLAPGGPARATVVWGEHPTEVPVRIRLVALSDLAFVVAAVRRWLDLDSHPDLWGETVGHDPLLAPLHRRWPGIRIPGAIDAAETAMFTVLGQQVSLAAARTFQSRFVEHWGQDVGPHAPGFRASPRAEAIAAADPERLRATLGLTGGRVRALQGVAGVLASGVSLGPGADRVLARSALLECWGIGPWTADYVALRCLGDPNAFPADDLIVKRRLGVSSGAEARALAAGWQPWRGYATMLLWTDAVFSAADSSVR